MASRPDHTFDDELGDVMASVMLCGTRETAAVLGIFIEECQKFQLSPWSFLDGTIQHNNGLISSWEENSVQSITAADIAIFVMFRELGTIAWETEFRVALETGIPTEFFCLRDTYEKYEDAAKGAADFDPLQDRINSLIEEHKVTVIPFSEGKDFAEKLNIVLSRFIKEGMGALAESNRRRFQRMLVHEDPIPQEHLRHIEAIALDEFEDKNLRKRAIDRLVDREYLNEANALNLMTSMEQGVARKMMSLAGRLAERFPPSFLEEVAEIVNSSDDVGVERRFVASMGQLPWQRCSPALLRLRIEEVGTARRVLRLLSDVVRDPPQQLSSSDVRDIVRLVDACENFQGLGSIPALASSIREQVKEIDPR